MNVLDKIGSFLGSAVPTETIIEFDPSSNPRIESAEQLFTADFSRDGADLVLSNFSQPDIRILNYFQAGNPSDIHTGDGKILAGDVVEKLAGPEFPAQYAQTGTPSAGNAIGQVESISGEVTVQRASGVRETLSLGAKVFANDVVQTASGGSLSLTFIDGTIFTLAEASRMVLDSLIYDPASSENSGLFNLVEGSFIFIAGEVAKTGGMDVKTPAATMGIRGTTVLVKIVSNNGVTEVEVSLNQDPDGGLGQFTITGLDGSVIADVIAAGTKWLISPVAGQTREITKSPEELVIDQSFVGSAFDAYQSANQRVADGGEFVETDASSPQSPDNPDNDQNAPQEDQTEEPTEESPENEPGEDERRGDLGSGIETELATDTSQPETSVENVVISELVGGGETLTVDGFEALNETAFSVEEQPLEIDETDPLVGPVNSPPNIEPPTVTTEVLEDGSVRLNGFNITDPEGDILTARITAGSTLTLATGSGVTILEGSGVDEVVTVIRGTGEQITNALNGAIYMPTPDADVTGSLTVEVRDGEFRTIDVTIIDISPIQDAPVAMPDLLEANQNASGLSGNVLANDFDVDTNPTPDQLTVTSVTIDGVNHVLGDEALTVTLASRAEFTISQNGSYNFDIDNVFTGLGEGETDSETISYTLSDGNEAEHGQTVTGQLSVTVTGVNDVPVILGDGQVSVAEGQVTTLTQADLSTEDPDQSASNLVYTVLIGPSQGQLELASASGTPITSFTQQQIDDGEVVYAHGDSLATSDTFSFAVTDGDAVVNGSMDVSITQINDDPSGTGLPISLTITEDTPGSLDLTTLQLNDPDAADSVVTLTLVTENAGLSAQSTTAVTITTTSTGLLLEGTIADLNAALSDPAYITLSPAADLSGIGAATVTASINDNGNTGSGGGSDIPLGTIAVNITGVNDAPTLSGVPTTLTLTEDVADTEAIRDFTITDVDAGSEQVTLTFHQTGGTLTFYPSTTVEINGNILTGTVDELNGYLDTGENNLGNITFTPDLNSTDPVTITATVDDLGNSGSGGAQTATGTTVINFTPVNDAPVLAVNDEEASYTENDPATAITSSVTIEDPDDTQIESAVVKISENFQAGDILGFTNTAAIVGEYDSATGILTLTGSDSLENYTTALESITYSHTTDDISEAVRTISYVVSDGDSNSIPTTATISPTAVNDAPVLTEFPIEFFVDEDITQVINFFDLEPFGETFSDPDAADNPVQLTFTLSGGVLTLPPGGADVSINGLTLTGTVAAINDYLNNGGTDDTFVRFTTDLNSTETVDLNITVNDLGNSGDGGSLTDSVDLEIVVFPVDDPAEVTLSADTNTFTENDDPRVVDNSVTVSDVDSANLISATVEISTNFQAGADILGFTDTANITGSYDSATGLLTLSGTDTLAAYEAALSSVTFLNTSDNPTLEGRDIVFNVNDGLGNGFSDTITMQVNASNDAPVVTISSSTQSYTEDAAPIAVDAAVAISDVDNTTIQSAEVTIGSGLEVPTDLLGFTATGNITGSYDASLGMLTLTGEDTLANYQAVLQSVTFSSSSENPSGDDRVIQFEINDGLNTSNIATVTVSVSASNDAPEINLDSVAASTEFIINGGFEEGVDPYDITILSNGSTDITSWTVTDDNISYFTDFHSGTGEGSRSVDLNGDQPGAISTTISTVVGQTYELSFLAGSNGTSSIDVFATGGAHENYTVDMDITSGQNLDYIFTATAVMTTITFTSSGTGVHGPQLDDVTLREVTGATIDVVEDTPIEISNIQVSDADATGSITVTLSADYGTLIVNYMVLDGVDISDISNNGTYSVTLTGSQEAINETLAAADGVIYTPNLDFNGTDTIEVLVDDGGSTGTGGAQTATATITLNVQSVDDSPPANADIGDVVEGNVATLTGIQLVGNEDDKIGNSVSNIGDINNDGIDDFAVGAVTASGMHAGIPESGSVYVIYGDVGGLPSAILGFENGETPIDYLTSTERGFELVGAATGDQAGFSVSGGGDLNNDGISDMVVGAHFADSILINSGAAYVIYGGQDFASLADTGAGEISLDTVGVTGTGNLQGFEITHPDSNAELSISANLTGDLNNDGISDLVISSVNTSTVDNSGTWVVFGGQDFSSVTDPLTGTFDLSDIDNTLDGFVLEGGLALDSAGVSVDVVGDFDGDGIDDLIIGAPNESYGAPAGGSFYLIYGGQDWDSLQATPSDPSISLTSLGPLSSDLQGFQIQGDTGYHLVGTTVSSAGDVNGDGLADLLATAPGDPASNIPGATYLIYGGQALTGTIATSTIGAAGTGTVNGAVFTEVAVPGVNVDSVSHASALGDIDGDGYSDILISTTLSGEGPDVDTGRAYIIYGSSAPSSGSHLLADVGLSVSGIQIGGENAHDLFGERAQSVGDINSDGYNDFVVTASGNLDGGLDSGSAYVVYGSDFENQVDQVAGADVETGSPGRDIIHGTAGDDVISGAGGDDIITTGAGDDEITIGDDSINFIDAGAGTDTLIFGDAGSFDLTLINDLRLQSIEALNTANGLVNDVTLGITDIFQISDDANADLEGLLGAVLPTSFMIDADATDIYTFENGAAGGIWTLNTGLSAGVSDYNIYEYVEGGSSDVLATLAIDDDVTPTIV